MYTLSIYLYSDKYQTPNPGAGVCQQINAQQDPLATLP